MSQATKRGLILALCISLLCLPIATSRAAAAGLLDLQRAQFDPLQHVPVSEIGDQMTSGFLGFSWYVWGLLCLAVAAVYARIWPRPVGADALRPRSRWRQLVLRWFHALVWVLLAASCFLRPLPLPGGPIICNILALLGLLAYFIFVATFVQDRVLRR